MDDFVFTPAPPNVSDLLDPDAIAAGVAAFLTGDEREMLQAGALSWILDGFDEFGLGRVSVVVADTGALIGSADVHWSVIVRAA